MRGLPTPTRVIASDLAQPLRGQNLPSANSLSMSISSACSATSFFNPGFSHLTMIVMSGTAVPYGGHADPLRTNGDEAPATEGLVIYTENPANPAGL